MAKWAATVTPWVLHAFHTFRNRKLRCIVPPGTAIPQLPTLSARRAAVSTQRTERARVHCWPHLLGVLWTLSSAWWSIGPVWKRVTRWSSMSVASPWRRNLISWLDRSIRLGLIASELHCLSSGWTHSPPPGRTEVSGWSGPLPA